MSKITSLPRLLIVTLFAACLAGCTGEAADPEPKAGEPDAGVHKHEKGPNGGELLEIGGDVGHVEVVHNDSAARLEIWVFAMDTGKSLDTEAAPVVNLKTSDGPKQLACQSVEGSMAHFTAEDDALKAHEAAGQVVLKVAGKEHFVAFVIHEHE